jgi:phage terminase large subunit-like protein
MDSPGRLDALVWAGTELMLKAKGEDDKPNKKARQVIRL